MLREARCVYIRTIAEGRQDWTALRLCTGYCNDCDNLHLVMHALFFLEIASAMLGLFAI